jgi:FMN phosphatase YigB (HAD superfamily)
MKNKREGFVFDMDGTLYCFDDDPSIRFENSNLSQQVKNNIIEFIRRKEKCSDDSALDIYRKLQKKYGAISVGILKEYAIPKKDYFDATWDINPKGFISQEYNLDILFHVLSMKSVILTATPKIWALRVLSHLNILSYVSKHIYASEDYTTKQDVEVWKKISKNICTQPQEILSVGDTYETDLKPAKMLGALTVLVGSQNSNADYSISSISSLLDLINSEGLL